MTSEPDGPRAGPLSFAGGCLRGSRVYGMCTTRASEPIRCPLDAYERSVLYGCE